MSLFLTVGCDQARRPRARCHSSERHLLLATAPLPSLTLPLLLTSTHFLLDAFPRTSASCSSPPCFFSSSHKITHLFVQFSCIKNNASFLSLYCCGTTDAHDVTLCSTGVLQNVKNGLISCPSGVVLCLLMQDVVFCDLPSHTTQPTTN